MKKFFYALAAYFVFTANTFSQDSLRSKYSHVIGVGLQYTPDRYIFYGHDTHKLTYTLPGYNLFYRFLLPDHETNCVTAFSGDFFYRHGYGTSYTGGNGGGNGADGNFEFIRCNLGISEYKRLRPGKKLYVDLGAGITLGRLIYSEEKTKGHGFGVDGSYAYTPDKELNNYYLSLNVEINIGIKLAPKNYLIVGGRQYLETGDGFGIKRNYTHTVFVAFSIGKHTGICTKQANVGN